MDPFAGLTATPSATLRARVLYNYAPQAANQLSIVAGQELTILLNGGPGGWSKGQDHLGMCMLH